MSGNSSLECKENHICVMDGGRGNKQGSRREELLENKNANWGMFSCFWHLSYSMCPPIPPPPHHDYFSKFLFPDSFGELDPFWWIWLKCWGYPLGGWGQEPSLSLGGLPHIVICGIIWLSLFSKTMNTTRVSHESTRSLLSLQYQVHCLAYSTRKINVLVSIRTQI